MTLGDAGALDHFFQPGEQAAAFSFVSRRELAFKATQPMFRMFASAEWCLFAEDIEHERPRRSEVARAMLVVNRECLARFTPQL